jgi:arylsulfatase A
MKILGILLVGLLGSLAVVSATTKKYGKAGTKPNFIVMFMDDLGYGDMGFTGHPTTKTPNLDRLAWNGKILTTWYSGCNVCSGSRAAMMTGRQFPRSGLPGVLGPTTKGGLNLNETTIAEQLKKGGYTTAIMGKWHLGQREV